MMTQIQEIIKNHQSDPTELIAILRDVQAHFRQISKDAIQMIADELDLNPVHVEGTASFYHFFSHEHRGQYTVYLNTSITAEMAGLVEVAQAFEEATGIRFGQTTPDLFIGLYETSCIGMSDQEPSALINDIVFPRLTPERVKHLVAGMKEGKPISELRQSFEEIQNPVHLQGPVFFTHHTSGEALKRALEQSSLDVIETIKKSELRGRGGAGFPTGQKWGFCRSTEADRRYVFCNADEGEPGTFKDRVLLTQMPELIFEGMTIAGYAIEAKEGFLYLRAEYAYLREQLEKTLADLRARKLLGRKILGTRFSFDIRIKTGAGAYICGEESALIESAQGKRGEPRNRPPFPVTSGYLHQPTIVNKPETFGCAAQIVLKGAPWFKKMGTEASTGVKLLSIAGDCSRPGIYEIEWGRSVREILELCGAEDPWAVQVGGPSGVCVSEKGFDRKLCYSDLPTGGAFTVFSRKRDLFSIVQNHMEFFTRESCGFCVPCRAGNQLLLRALKKVRAGNGTLSDLKGIEELGKLVKKASRCGLGQTSPQPLLTTLENFQDTYHQKVRADVDFQSQFDLNLAVADAAKLR